MKILLTTIGAVLWFIISISPVHAQIGHDSIDWEAVDSAFYAQYDPEVPPQWLFPIIFEEGTGMRDTVYLGYHPNATKYWGTRENEPFGAIKTRFDTSYFNASWLPVTWWSDDSTNNVRVASLDGSAFGGVIEFHKAVYPLYMYWDVERLDDPKLPFKKQEALPNAMGWVGARLDNMHKNLDSNGMIGFRGRTTKIPVTDTPKKEGNENFAKNGLIFNDWNEWGTETPYSFSFFITKWGDDLGTSIESQIDNDIKVYPNPFRKYEGLRIDNLSYKSYQYKITNLQGRKIKKGTLDQGENHLDFTVNETGVHILKIMDSSGSIVALKRLIVKP